MEEQFGTVKQVMKMDCTINGVGQATIMQSEVEGIPLSKVIEFAKPKASANIVSPIGSDGYDYAQMPIDWVVDNNAILVTKMDGETLPNTQGYPCMVWVYNTSGGNFVKRISNLTFMTQPEDAAMSQVYLGEFADDCTGEVYSKPNSGVLNYPTNVVLTGDEPNRCIWRASPTRGTSPSRSSSSPSTTARPGRRWTRRITIPSTGPTGAWTSRRPRPGRT